MLLNNNDILDYNKSLIFLFIIVPDYVIIETFRFEDKNDRSCEYVIHPRKLHCTFFSPEKIELLSCMLTRWYADVRAYC